MRGSLFTTVAVVVGGCATTDEREVVPTGSFTQAQADAIADTCGAGRGWLSVHPSGEVRFEPPVEADYKASLCILQRIKEIGVTKLGFVGAVKAVPDE